MKNNFLVAICLTLVSFTANAETTITIKKTHPFVEFSVCNNADVSIINFIGVRIEKKEPNDWALSRWDTECPCMAKCKKTVTHIEPHQCKEFTWNKKTSDCKNAGEGSYRLMVFGNRSIKERKNSTLAESSVFKLK